MAAAGCGLCRAALPPPPPPQPPRASLCLPCPLCLSLAPRAAVNQHRPTSPHGRRSTQRRAPLNIPSPRPTPTRSTTPALPHPTPTPTSNRPSRSSTPPVSHRLPRPTCINPRYLPPPRTTTPSRHLQGPWPRQSTPSRKPTPCIKWTRDEIDDVYISTIHTKMATAHSIVPNHNDQRAFTAASDNTISSQNISCINRFSLKPSYVKVTRIELLS